MSFYKTAETLKSVPLTLTAIQKFNIVVRANNGCVPNELRMQIVKI